MANPILTKALAARAPQAQPYQQPPFQQGYAQPSYGQPTYSPQPGYGTQQGYAQPGYPVNPHVGYYGQQQVPDWQGLPASSGRMTLDDVLTKTALTMGLMMLVATAVFFIVPPELARMAWIVGGLGAVIVSFVAAFRSTIGPVMALTFGLLEGLFVGAITKFFEMVYPGIAIEAVMATFVVAVVVLAAVKIFKIRIGHKLRMMLGVATMAFAVAMLLNFVLSLFSLRLGLWDGIGTITVLGVAMTVIGTALATFNLVQDFADVAEGIEAGVPASESWRAAFGITATMVWLYINLLRILSYLKN